MKIKITRHANERMRKYNVTKLMVKEALDKPSSIFRTRDGRSIFNRRLDGYLLRVIAEESSNIIFVITVYKAKSARYEV